MSEFRRPPGAVCFSARPCRAWRAGRLLRPKRQRAPAARRRQGGWSRCVTSMPAFSTWPIMKRARRMGRSRSCCTAFPTTFTPMSMSPRNWRRRAAASSSPICGASARRVFATRRRLRSGEQAAIGADVIALMDALGIRRAVLAGHNWGGRAACVAAALWPERCTRHGDGEQLPDPGPRAGHGADQPEI